MQAYFRKARAKSWKIYTKYYPKSSYKRHQDRYLDTVMKYLSPAAHLLDAGCGREMEFTRQLERQVRLAVGIDIEALEPRLSGAHAAQGDLGRLPFQDEAFDIIVSQSVFEHLAAPETVLREFARVLKPNGKIVILTPNKYDYISIVSTLTPLWFHKWVLSWTLDNKEEDVFPTHYLINSKKQIVNLFRKSDLKLMKVTLFNQYPSYLLFSPVLFRFGILYERLTSRYEALANLRSWVLLVAEEKGIIEDYPPKQKLYHEIAHVKIQNLCPKNDFVSFLQLNATRNSTLSHQQFADLKK